jgi:flagellin-specific chaperone FliS
MQFHRKDHAVQKDHVSAYQQKSRFLTFYLDFSSEKPYFLVKLLYGHIRKRIRITQHTVRTNRVQFERKVCTEKNADLHISRKITIF